MSYYITRIFNNKLKLGVILYIFIAPILDILLTLIDLSKGASVPAPYLATFLGGFSIGGLRKLLKWYLPLLLAIVVADDCIEDYRIGYKNILITKRGKNKYFALNMLSSCHTLTVCTLLAGSCLVFSKKILVNSETDIIEVAFLR